MRHLRRLVTEVGFLNYCVEKKERKKKTLVGFENSAFWDTTL
jgi:hypothetical protein